MIDIEWLKKEIKRMEMFAEALKTDISDTELLLDSQKESLWNVQNFLKTWKAQLPIYETNTDLDRFIKDNIEFVTDDNAVIKVLDIYECYLKYFEFTSEDIGKCALTRQKFIRFLKRNYEQIMLIQKRINGDPELCFTNIQFKPKKEAQNA